MTTGNYKGVAYTYTKEAEQDMGGLGLDVEAEIQAAIDREVEVLSESSATIYTKSNCPFCVRAKRLLESRGVQIIEINAVEHRDQLIESVTKTTGRPPKTVPQIWLDDQYIGGFEELDAHFKAL